MGSEVKHYWPEDIAVIMFHCEGDDDATEVDERFQGGVLWVGETLDDDGSKSYGLNIACVECLEEGSTPVVEFSPPAMLAAAPPVKAEQVQCAFCDDTGQIQGTDCGRCAPSLPAAGSAVEEVEVVGYRFFHVDHGYIFRRTHIYEGNPSLEAHGLMTVAQHERILAALAAGTGQEVGK